MVAAEGMYTGQYIYCGKKGIHIKHMLNTDTSVSARIRGEGSKDGSCPNFLFSNCCI